MAHAEGTIDIKAPPVTVFKFLADGTNNPKWHRGVVRIKLASEKSQGVGTVYKQMLKGPAGSWIAGDYEITAYKPNKQLSFKVIAGPARPAGDYFLKSKGGGTNLRFVLDYPPRGFIGGLMDQMVNSSMQREVARLTDLKKYLESP